MSPTLFNLILDAALNGLQRTVKYENSNLNYVAFADDLVILANTEYELQEKLNQLHTSMKIFGLEINPKKCKCVHLKINRKVKTHYVATKPEIVVDGVRIPNLNADENYKYVGISITPDGIRLCKKTYTRELKLIERCKLKTHQNMKVLRQHLLPQFLYTLGEMRVAVRKWLHLPKDFPSAMIHAKIVKGGLGISRISDTTIEPRNETLKSMEREMGCSDTSH